MSSIDPSPLGREPGRVYRIEPETTGPAGEVGWDSHLGAFFGQPVDLDADGTVVDVGGKVYALTALRDLEDRLGLRIPADIAEELYRDALAFPADPSDHVLGDWASMLYRQLGVVPRSSLPAQPVVDLVFAQATEWADSDVDAVGVRLGLNGALVDGILGGSVTELSIPQIAHVCEALRCSPFDMWGTERARSILHAYGPEAWPAHIEPLAATWPGEPRLHSLPAPPPPDAIVTPYRSAGYMTVDRDGRPVDPFDRPPNDPELRRQPVFDQAAEPRLSSLPPDAAPPDDTARVDPRLATTAFAIRDQMDEPFDRPGVPSARPIDLVRFTWPGQETWLAFNPHTHRWETTTAPWVGYAGSPTEIIDTNGLTNPHHMLLDDQTRPRGIPPAPVATNGPPPQRSLPPSPDTNQPPFGPGADVIVTGYQRTATLAIDDRGHATALPEGSAHQDNVVSYHYAFRQVTRPSTYPLFGHEPATAGDGVDPFLASVATYRIQDHDTGDPASPARIDMVRISPASDGRFADGPEVWLGWSPQTGTWELWDDPRHHYPHNPRDVLDPAGHVPPELWDTEQERLAITTHDSPGIPALPDDLAHPATHQPDAWLLDPIEPPTGPDLEL